jgi:type I restriction enzyme S subunit
MPEVNRSIKATGWTSTAFGDVVQLSNERTAEPAADGYERYIGLEHIDPGELHVARWGDIADGVTFTSVFHPGQVLFGKRRAYQRKVAVADFSGVCSGDIYVLEPKGDALLPDLLPFICQTDAFFEHAVGTSAGSLSPRTNWKSLANFEFSLPPIEEQRRMVEVLKTSLNAVHATERLVLRTKQVRMSTICSFETRATLDHNLNSMISLLESGKSPPITGESASPGGLGVLKVSAVGDWEYVPSESKAVAPDEYTASLAVQQGDLLIARANADPDSVGRSCVVATSRDGLMLSDKTWRARLSPQADGLTYGVLAWTKSRAFRIHVRNHLNGTDAKNISKPLFLAGPAPHIDDAFKAFDRQIRDLCTAVRALTIRLQSARDFHRKLLDEVVVG